MTTTINASTSAGLVNTADTSGILQLQTAGTAAVTVDASQNVGIGRTSSGYKFEVNDTSLLSQNAGSTTGSVGVALVVDGKTSGAYATGQGSALQFQITNSAGGYSGGKISSINNADPFTADLVFYPRNYGFTEAMRINSSGNVFVGTTSTAATSGGIAVLPQSGNTNITVGHATGVASGEWYMGFRYNGTGIGSITQNGTTGVLFNITSDYRLKENATKINNGLETIAKLNPVTFTWKTDNTEDSGFIAHEFQSVLPRSVVGEKDAVDEEGNPIYQGMDNSGAIPYLVAAIQEQQTLIVSQSELINNLTARVTALEAK